jgi:hypothetical protein
VWRWLAEDAIRPWAWRSWVFARDPDFRAKAGRVLDLYARRWEGQRLHPGDYVIGADEKTQLQALLRRHPLVAAGPGPARTRRARVPPLRDAGLSGRDGRIEIYFSILARKALTPAHFHNTDEVAECVVGFQHEYAKTANPFDWT